MANPVIDPMTDADSEILDALADLERNTPEHYKRMRSDERITIRARVTAQPGNSSQRFDSKTRGMTIDVSKGGCLIVFPVPLQVGDIYWIAFDKNEIPVDPLFGRCVRCRLVNEDAVEAGFRFFNTIDLDHVLLHQSNGATGPETLFD